MRRPLPPPLPKAPPRKPHPLDKVGPGQSRVMDLSEKTYDPNAVPSISQQKAGARRRGPQRKKA